MGREFFFSRSLGLMPFPWTARLLAAGAVVVYVLQAWGYAHTQNSVLDEGDYLLKGLFFVRGVYRPFQDYGFWTNHMPLSFLIPGWVQAVFGPGLLVGRLYALALALIALAGVWAVARRLAGEWLAAVGLWMMALNPAVIKMYAVATSQVLIAAQLAWTLALTLGKERPRWQVIAGAALAGVLLLTRLNLAPIFPLLVLYIIWQHGLRTGLWAAAVGLIVIIAGHALFWPGILRMWAAWSPPQLTPFLDFWRPPAGQPTWSPTVEPAKRVFSFLLGLRFHFLAILGFAGMLIFGSRRAYWRDGVSWRAAVFSAAAYGVLVAAHAWASLGEHSHTEAALGSNYCVFCFPVYSSFYYILGVLLLLLVMTAWPWPGSSARGGAFVLFTLAAGTGIGYGAFREISDPMLRWRVPRLMTLLTTGRWVPSDIPLWDVLATRFGMPFEDAKRLIPAVAGFLAAAGILALAWFAARRLRRKGGRVSLGAAAFLAVVVAGAVLTPTLVLGGGYVTYDCSGNVIAAYDQAGRYLAEVIPPGSRVYWAGSLSPAPLLFLDNPQLLPPQMNQSYSLRLSGEDDAHRRYGFWSPTIARAWLADADYAVVSVRNYTGWLQEALEASGEFGELLPTDPVAPCQADSFLRVFVRLEQP